MVIPAQEIAKAPHWRALEGELAHLDVPSILVLLAHGALHGVRANLGVNLPDQKRAAPVSPGEQPRARSPAAGGLESYREPLTAPAAAVQRRAAARVLFWDLARRAGPATGALASCCMLLGGSLLHKLADSDCFERRAGCGVQTALLQQSCSMRGQPEVRRENPGVPAALPHHLST